MLITIGQICLVFLKPGTNSSVLPITFVNDIFISFSVNKIKNIKKLIIIIDKNTRKFRFDVGFVEKLSSTEMSGNS